MKRQTFELSFYYILSAVIAVLLFFVFEPFIGSIFLAIVCASVFYPVHKRIEKYVKNKKSIAASLSLIGLVLLILAPLAIIFSLLLEEVVGLYSLLTTNGASDIASYVDLVNSWVQRIIPTFDLTAVQISSAIQSVLNWVLQHTTTIFSGVFSLALNVFIFLVALFYFLKDGKDHIDLLVKVSPLPDTYDRTIVEKIGHAFNSVVRGNLITAIIQGLLAGAGFALVGIGAPVLLGFVTIIAALIPSVGTGIVMLPVVLFLVVKGSYISAILLLVWAVVVVGLVDNLLRPILMQKGLNIHPGIILLSVLGGIAFFGPIGLIAGPVLAATGFALLDIYPLLVKKV